MIYVCGFFFFPPDVKQPSILDALSKSKPASSTAVKKVPSSNSSDSEGDEVPVPKTKPVLKRKQAISDESDSSSDDLMSRLKTKITAGNKVRGAPSLLLASRLC